MPGLPVRPRPIKASLIRDGSPWIDTRYTQFTVSTCSFISVLSTLQDTRDVSPCVSARRLSPRQSIVFMLLYQFIICLYEIMYCITLCYIISYYILADITFRHVRPCVQPPHHSCDIDHYYHYYYYSYYVYIYIHIHNILVCMDTSPFGTRGLAGL